MINSIQKSTSFSRGILKGVRVCLYARFNRKEENEIFNIQIRLSLFLSPSIFSYVPICFLFFRKFSHNFRFFRLRSFFFDIWHAVRDWNDWKKWRRRKKERKEKKERKKIKKRRINENWKGMKKRTDSRGKKIVNNNQIVVNKEGKEKTNKQWKRKNKTKRKN